MFTVTVMGTMGMILTLYDTPSSWVHSTMTVMLSALYSSEVVTVSEPDIDRAEKKGSEFCIYKIKEQYT